MLCHKLLQRAAIPSLTSAIMLSGACGSATNATVTAAQSPPASLPACTLDAEPVIAEQPLVRPAIGQENEADVSGILLIDGQTGIKEAGLKLAGGATFNSRDPRSQPNSWR